MRRSDLQSSKNKRAENGHKNGPELSSAPKSICCQQAYGSRPASYLMNGRIGSVVFGLFRTRRPRGPVACFARLFAISISVCSCSDYSPAASSRCSDATTIAAVKDQAGIGILKVYEKLGVRMEATIDAIRTVLESPKSVLCQARLTVKAMKAGQNQSDVAANKGDQDLRGLESLMNSTAFEITYKVELTDDGQNYVTVMP